MVKPHASNPRAVRERKHANRRFYKENPLIPTPEQAEQAKRDQQMADLKAWADSVDEVATELLARQPDLHVVTAHVMAQDIISARRATGYVESGEMPAEQAYVHVGSFARWDWVITMMALRRIGTPWFEANICDLWRGSDPDDTNPEYLKLWRTARYHNGGYIRDGRPLPRSRDLQVYRGGAGNFTHGIAWTLDPKVAQKFALGAGARIAIKGGYVVGGTIKRGDVIAFITGRNESEVIVDPRAVGGLHITGAAK